MISRVIALLFAGAAGYFAQVTQSVWTPLDEAHKEASLEIVYLTSFGAPMRSPLTIRVSVDSRSDEKTRLRLTGNSTSLRLKYGEYRIHAECPGFYPVDRVLYVRESHHTVLVCFFQAPIEAADPDGNLIRGKLSEASARAGCRLVRLVSPYSSDSWFETRANESGHFAFKDVRPGKYLAIFIEPSRICETREVTVGFDRLQDLPSNAERRDGKVERGEAVH
jgi:hypothetical protein